MTDYSPIQLATPWKRTVLLVLLAAVLLLAGIGAAVFFGVRHFAGAEMTTPADAGV